MGWLDENGDWISGDRDAADKQRHQAARAYLAEGADRVDRPVEQATAGQNGDQTSKAARQVLELGRHGGDIDHISTLLALKRAAAGETNPEATAAQNRKAVGELADDFDDVVEANHAEDDQDGREDFYDWLLDEYGWTEHDLALQFQQLNEQDQDQALGMLGDLYAASGDETDDDADDDADYEDEDDDEGDHYGDDAGYDTEGADYATADGADWQAQ